MISCSLEFSMKTSYKLGNQDIHLTAINLQFNSQCVMFIDS